MSFGEFERSLLAARDARQAEIDRRLGSGWPAVIAVSLGIPGPDKTPPGSLSLFTLGEHWLACALRDAKQLHRSDDALGSFAVWGTSDHPASAKERCLAIEAGSPAARLLDLDVYGLNGKSIDRSTLHLPPRTCLACAAPAGECIRLGRHPQAEVISAVYALLLPFST